MVNPPYERCNRCHRIEPCDCFCNVCRADPCECRSRDQQKSDCGCKKSEKECGCKKKKKKEECCSTKIEGFLPAPDCEGCFNFFPILFIDPCELKTTPMVILLGTDGNYHFPNEPVEGRSFWFIITGQRKFVIVVPEKSLCLYPKNSPYTIVL